MSKRKALVYNLQKLLTNPSLDCHVIRWVEPENSPFSVFFILFFEIFYSFSEYLIFHILICENIRHYEGHLIRSNNLVEHFLI